MLLRCHLFLLLGLVAWAQVEPISITLEAFIVSEATREDGTIEEQFVEAELARPGDIIEYRLTVTNTSDATIPPGNLSLVGPVPESTRYLAGSATISAELARFDVSLDGGESFAELPILIIVTNEQGEEVEVEAGPELYTALRWTLLAPLAPQASLTFVYRVIVQ